MFNAEEASKTVEIVKVLNISKVYFIDDLFEDTSDIDKLIDALSGDLSPQIEEIVKSHIPGAILNAPAEVVSSSISEAWSNLTLEQRRDAIRIFEQALGTSFTKEDATATFVKDTFGTEIPVHTMGPSEWEHISTKVVADASTTDRVFCLFDQDLSNAKDYGEKGGIKLIKKLTNDDKKGVILSAIFSGGTAKDDEIDEWHRLVEEQSLPSSAFFPLSKDRINSSEDFKNGVQKSSLNGLYDIVKKSTFTLIKEASENTYNELNKLPLYDFQHVVVTSSNPQGIWEAVTLLRIYNVLQDDNIKRRMVINNYAEDFNKIIKDADKINTIGGSSPLADLTVRAKLRHQEFYESGETINSNYSALQTGDIFRSVDDKGINSDYILIAQACDLTVRGKTGERRSKMLHLAPIKQMDSSKYESKKSDPKKSGELASTFLLQYYKSGSTDIGLVEISKIFAINASILDLAVLNPNGKCQIDVSNPVDCPPQLYTALQKRFTNIIAEFSGYHQSFQEAMTFLSTLADGDQKNKILSSVLPLATLQLYKDKMTLPENPYSNGSFDYKLSRVSRLRSPYSEHLLEEYTRFLSRAAFDHDFVK